MTKTVSKSIQTMLEFVEESPLKTTISNHPEIDGLDWMKQLSASYPCLLSGQSLKYIRSRLPVLVFEMGTDTFSNCAQGLEQDKLAALPEPCRPTLRKFHLSASEIKFILKREDSHKRDLHILIRQTSNTDGPVISIDRLRYDQDRACWSGEEQALNDLEEGCIRLITPKQLDTRLGLQLCTLASLLDFQLEPELLQEAKEHVSLEDFKELPARLLQKQFRKLVCGAKPSSGFLFLREVGLLEGLLPELAAGYGLTQNRYHKYDIFYHSIYACDSVPEPDLALRLAALFHDLGKVDTRKEKPNGEASFHNHELVSTRHTDRILRRLGFEHWLIKRVKFLVRNHMFHYTSEWSDRAVRRFIKKVRPEVLQDLLTLRLADRRGSGKRSTLPWALKEMIRHMLEVTDRDAELQVHDLAISGHTLMELGMRPGPEMGALLRSLLEKVKAEELQNEEATLKEAAVAWLTDANEKA